MALSKEARIITLLIIDSAFFFLEIIVGYAVGSLALVADSFHMLNDVMSLIVALYAVKLSAKSSNSKDPRYSYGWQRAEILGALINGVFLLALCFSIFMEAIERFVNISREWLEGTGSVAETVHALQSTSNAHSVACLVLWVSLGISWGRMVKSVDNPKLVIVVGSLGLASNLLGLVLFHDHGHSHGGHSHSHGHSHGPKPTVLPAPAAAIVSSDESATAVDPSIDSAEGHSRENSVSTLLGHPAQTRAFVVQTAHSLGYESAPASSSDEAARLVGHGGGSANSNYGATSEGHSHDHDIEAHGTTSSAAKAHAHDDHGHDHGHEGHDHSHGGHSHGSEGSMNMRGVFLHVLGDALGNVGVITSGVIIMLCKGEWRFYTDPAISFLITIIIFTSALPLVKSASFILLQGVPTTIPLETVKESLLAVTGVLSVHDLHIWQLSESKIVASVHVLVDCDDLESQRYMSIATELRRLLHGWGIHSATIQPEFVKGGLGEAARRSGVAIHPDRTDDQGRLLTEDGELVEAELSRNGAACLLTCGPDTDGEACAAASCCPPVQSGRNSPNINGTTSD